ncbi:MAG: hypothetical protein K6E12_02415 [Saccharofermentans sp.]|nr:hypothetical protein [Saccharofermentans sp.]
MKSTKFLTAGSMILASVMLFAGCAGITHEPEVDVDSLKEIDEEDFFKALEAIGIEESDTEIMEDSSFSFSGEDIDYEVEYCIDAYADNENYYSYVRCVDEDTAMALFEYYYSDYKDVFDAKDFSGISSHEVGSNTAYVLIDGRYDDKAANTYTPYHDAIFLKGDTLVIAIASDYDLSIEKEVNTFLDALGYPHP